MEPRAWTVDEADRLVPRLEAVFRDLDVRREEAQRAHDRAQVLELLWGDRLREPDNPDHAEAILARTALVEATRAIERAIREEIVDLGLRFPPGGLEQGLVDFPTTWEGRWVLLCWHRGEPALQAWHELDAGFRGRQPITVEQRRGMGNW